MRDPEVDPLESLRSIKPPPPIISNNDFRAIHHHPVINAKITYRLETHREALAKEYKLPSSVVSLYAEYALHAAEKSIAGAGVVRSAVIQRMETIRQRLLERGFSTGILSEIERSAAQAAQEIQQASLPFSTTETLHNLLTEKIVKPTLQLAKSGNPTSFLDSARTLNEVHKRLDPLNYRLGADGPTLRSQLLPTAASNARPRGSLASRGGYSRGGRQRTPLSGAVDCSGYALQCIRAIAVSMLTLQGLPLFDSIQKAQTNIPDTNTAEMLKQARREKIGDLPQRPSAQDIQDAFNEGRIKLGDALVVPPRPGRKYGHVGMLALDTNGELVVHESTTGKGVVEMPLKRWETLAQERGELRIFRHYYLKELGVFDC